uniref:type I protein arginine methyltransferase n=1 Tax=Pinguiococcus pyrenoidosus TaxID=172671 RepID=A0A7R9U1C9_9STRA|mmetsp:Transcript_11229/g.41933  ORF Transcript_11229/g.41933 Transcript_11229/m.41933 type:complete len:383 (+) Transcript_11229:243-1391(+)
MEDSSGEQVPDLSAADNPFTQYYAQLTHQQNMLQDATRTGTYQQAMLRNPADFQDKVVLDVGTGTGILAFFAVQAGARKVYAVEASDMAMCAQALVESNDFAKGVIEVVKGKMEEIELPEKVDIVISEPIGFLLVHERMLESYVVARDRFLKPNGLMMPTTGSIVCAPMTDEALFNEQSAKSRFWQSERFYGIDMRVLEPFSNVENFAQPIVGYFFLESLLTSERAVKSFDFSKCTKEELTDFDLEFRFLIDRTAVMHGLGCWFDITFDGSMEQVILSTAPDMPGTHWYQCRLLLRDPIAVNRGQTVTGSLKFVANSRFSYDITFSCRLEGTDITSQNHIKLQDQLYHYLTNPSAAMNHPSYQQGSSQQYEYGGALNGNNGY